MLQSGLVMQSAWQGLVVPPGGSQQQQPNLWQSPQPLADTAMPAQNFSVTAIAAVGAAIDTISGRAAAAAPTLTERMVNPRRVIMSFVRGAGSNSWESPSCAKGWANRAESRSSSPAGAPASLRPAQGLHTRAAAA